MKKGITVLLTGAGAPGAPGIINCYRRNGEREIRIVSVDMNENAAGRLLVDAFYTVPKAYDDAFIPAIMEICQKEKVDVVVPIVTRELEKFAESRDMFDSYGISVSVLKSDILAVVNDKGFLFDAMIRNGIKTARYKVVDNVQSLFDAVHEMGYPKQPVCVKVTTGNGSRGVRIIDVAGNGYERFFNEKPSSSFTNYGVVYDALHDRQIPRMMVMEYLPGSEYSVDVLAAEDGIKAMVCRKGVRVVSSIQVESIVENNESVLSLCREVVEKLKIIGEFGFDVKCDANEEPYIIEINPRLTAGIVACAAAGCNIPYYELLRQIREPIPNFTINYGTVMTRHWKEVFFTEDGKSIEWA